VLKNQAIRIKYEFFQQCITITAEILWYGSTADIVPFTMLLHLLAGEAIFVKIFQLYILAIILLYHSDVEDIEQFEFVAVFSASDNVQSGDVACVTLSIVADNILEPTVDFLVLFSISPLVNEPQDSPDFTRVRIIDTTAQGRACMALAHS
jgi:hypothetical protein